MQEMAKILQHPKVFSFLHVPVQSASDKVLGDMKREYTVDDFTHVVDFLKDRWVAVRCHLYPDSNPNQNEFLKTKLNRKKKERS